MTCVLGVASGGNVLLCADGGFTINGITRCHGYGTKLRKFSNFIIGYAGFADEGLHVFDKIDTTPLVSITSHSACDEIADRITQAYLQPKLNSSDVWKHTNGYLVGYNGLIYRVWNGWCQISVIDAIGTNPDIFIKILKKSLVRQRNAETAIKEAVVIAEHIYDDVMCTDTGPDVISLK